MSIKTRKDFWRMRSATLFRRLVISIRESKARSGRGIGCALTVSTVFLLIGKRSIFKAKLASKENFEKPDYKALLNFYEPPVTARISITMRSANGDLLYRTERLTNSSSTR